MVLCVDGHFSKVWASDKNIQLNLLSAAVSLYSGIHGGVYPNLSPLTNDSIALINGKIILNYLVCSHY